MTKELKGMYTYRIKPTYFATRTVGKKGSMPVNRKHFSWLVYFVTNIRYATRLSVYTVT